MLLRVTFKSVPGLPVLVITIVAGVVTGVPAGPVRIIGCEVAGLELNTGKSILHCRLYVWELLPAASFVVTVSVPVAGLVPGVQLTVKVWLPVVKPVKGARVVV